MRPALLLLALALAGCDGPKPERRRSTERGRSTGETIARVNLRAGKRASGLQKTAQLRRKTNGRHFVPPSEWLVKNRKIKLWSG